RCGFMRAPLRLRDAGPRGTRYILAARRSRSARDRTDQHRDRRHGAGRHPAVPGNARPSLPPQTVYALRAARCARPRRQPTRLSMLRVLHVDSGREYRGGQDQVRLLARELARDPYVQQYLITRRGSELARRVATAGTPVHEVPWTIGLDPRPWWRLVLLARALRGAVIHAHDGHALGIALAARRWLDAQPRMVATRRVVFPVRRRRSLVRAARLVALSAAVE